MDTHHWAVLGTAISTLLLTHSPSHLESISKFQKALLVRYIWSSIKGPCIKLPLSIKRSVFKAQIFHSLTTTVCLMRKRDNIFLFIAPFLCVISLSCWFQIDIGETWSLWRTLLPSTWLKVCSNIYQRWHVKSACFYIILACIADALNLLYRLYKWFRRVGEPAATVGYTIQAVLDM